LQIYDNFLKILIFLLNKGLSPKLF